MLLGGDTQVVQLYEITETKSTAGTFQLNMVLTRIVLSSALRKNGALLRMTRRKKTYSVILER